MNLKKFLKPDRRKIIITIFWPILAFLICGKKGLIYLYAIPVIFVIFLLRPGSDLILSSWLYFLLFLFPFYLLSCFIVWIYDKLKRKS